MTEEIKQEVVVVLNTEWRTRHVRNEDREVFLEGDQVGVVWDNGGITLRYHYVTEGVVEYKFAICNPKDQYSRKLGTEIADASTEVYTIALPPIEIPQEALVSNILLDIVNVNRKKLSPQTMALIYRFVTTEMIKSVRKFFFPVN